MADDKNKQELVTKVGTLVKEKFDNDFQRAFNHYTNGSGTGYMSRERLKDLLKEADVGNTITRDAWADGIMKEMDTDSDGYISWREFQDTIK